MSTNRVLEQAGWVDQTKMPKGPNGRNLCRWCQQEVPAGRRTFCSEECIHQHKLRSNPGYVRSCVYGRDRGVCAGCGADTEQQHKEHGTRYYRLYLKVNQRMDKRVPKLVEGVDYVKGDIRAWDRRWKKVKALTMKRMEVWSRRTGLILMDSPRWEADHIIPVSEGGGECGLENYRTLCRGCHKNATKELAARRAKRNREKPHVS